MTQLDDAHFELHSANKDKAFKKKQMLEYKELLYLKIDMANYIKLMCQDSFEFLIITFGKTVRV